MIRIGLEHPTLQIAVVTATPVNCQSSPADLTAQMRAAEQHVREHGSPEAVRAAIRDVLRAGGYKPSGRGKPASEFLFGAACGSGLPRVSNLVDINNLVSLRTALPISMFDAEKLELPAVLRFGRPGEHYVFNASGQTMDIAGIPVICRASTDEPVGNAVKDSMLAKVSPETRAAVAVIYSSTTLGRQGLQDAAAQLCSLLGTFAGATTFEVGVFPA